MSASSVLETVQTVQVRSPGSAIVAYITDYGGRTAQSRANIRDVTHASQRPNTKSAAPIFHSEVPIDGHPKPTTNADILIFLNFTHFVNNSEHEDRRMRARTAA